MNQWLYRKGRLNSVVRLAVFLTLASCPVSSYARPDMSPLGPNIADKGSAFYHFSVRTFDSADGKRHYKVWTGIPNKTPPASGYPAVYMLDGNAVMDRLSEAFLQTLSQHNPPVLVAIGYQTPLPFDLESRAWDYTPPAEGNEQALRGRKGGGSKVFRQLIEQTIAPQVEQNIAINPHQRALWGHSYGGLFVLDAYLSSAMFTAYYAAVPSVNRNNVALLNEITHTEKQRVSHKQLWLMEGDGEQRVREKGNHPDVLSAVRETASTLRDNGTAATFLLFPGLTHGEMFTASFQAALQRIASEE